MSKRICGRIKDAKMFISVWLYDVQLLICCYEYWLPNACAYDLIRWRCDVNQQCSFIEKWLENLQQQSPKVAAVVIILTSHWLWHKVNAVGNILQWLFFTRKKSKSNEEKHPTTTTTTTHEHEHEHQQQNHKTTLHEIPSTHTKHLWKSHVVFST